MQSRIRSLLNWSAAVLLAVVLGACGSSGSDVSPPETTDAAPATSPTTIAPATTVTTQAPAPTTVPSTAPPTTRAPAGPPVATITIAGFDFGEPITVNAGDTIEVVNSDRVTHTWTAKDNGPFNVTLAGDATTTFTFTEPGEYPFFCSIHPSMTGSVNVEG